MAAMVLVKDEVPLGGGVHVSFDGYQLWLRGPRPSGSPDLVALEPDAFDALAKFVADLRAELAAGPESGR